MCLTFPSLKLDADFIVIRYFISCTSADRYHILAGVSSYPEDRDSRFVRNIGAFGANYKTPVSRTRLSELEDFQLNLIEMQFNVLDWIQLTQGRVNRWTAVKTVRKFTVP
jgi:hypothetical protein